MALKIIKKLLSQNQLNFLVKLFFLIKQIKLEIKLRNLNFYIFIAKNFFISKSQINQELITLFLFNQQIKTKGYFIEIGACDGIKLSNTYLLEKKFKWSGLLCEPSRQYIKKIKKNRTSKIETKIILDKSNKKILFNDTVIPELSSIDSKKNQDIHSKIRVTKNKYFKKTLSLNDLLSKHNAPRKIDLLSIDTEGSEYEILKNCNFQKFQFRIIICEHNFNKNRFKIYKLLKKNGYIRKYKKISFFDDWFIKKNY